MEFRRRKTPEAIGLMVRRILAQLYNPTADRQGTNENKAYRFEAIRLVRFFAERSKNCLNPFRLLQ